METETRSPLPSPSPSTSPSASPSLSLSLSPQPSISRSPESKPLCKVGRLNSYPAPWFENQYEHWRSLNLLHLTLPDNIRIMPESFGDLSHLLKLTIEGKNLKSLPNSIAKLHKLDSLYLNNCFSLEELPPTLSELVSLTMLYISCTNIKSLPSSFTKLPTLHSLHLNKCYHLEELPPNLNELVSLCSLWIKCSNIKRLPCSISELPRLQALCLQNCYNLEGLPENLEKLASSLVRLVIGYTNIKCLPDSIMELNNLEVLDLRDCVRLNELPAHLDQFVTKLKYYRMPYVFEPVRRQHTVINEAQAEQTLIAEDGIAAETAARSPLKRMIREHEFDFWQPSGRIKCHHSVSARQTGPSGTFAFEASYRDETASFSQCLSANIDKLKEEIAQRLNLEVGTFEIKYLDDDHEWVLMACESDLQECLDIWKTSGSNMTRLLIQDIIVPLGGSSGDTSKV